MLAPRGVTLKELRGSPHISVSQLKTFLSCPRRYRLQYVDRVAPSFRPASLVFGGCFHHAVDVHFLNIDRHEPASFAAIDAALQDRLSDELRPDKLPVLFDEETSEDELRSKGRAMLGTFLASVPRFDRIEAVEVPFSLELVDPVTGEVLDLPLIGAVDVLAIRNGKPVIVELKTAKRRWSADEVANDQQITAYSLGLGEPGANLMLLVTTKTRQPLLQVEEPRRGEAEERDLVRTAFSVMRGVAAGVDHPVRSARTCGARPYAHACG